MQFKNGSNSELQIDSVGSIGIHSRNLDIAETYICISKTKAKDKSQGLTVKINEFCGDDVKLALRF